MINFVSKIDKLQQITGVDIPIEGLGITLRQPSIKEISILGESNYFVALRIFILDSKQLHIQDENVTNWQIFQKSLKTKISGVKDVSSLLTNFLQLFFVDKINIGPRSLLLMTKDGVKTIEPEDFNYIQDCIGILGGKSFITGNEETYKPANKRASLIAEKMKKAHKRLAKIQAAEDGDIDLNDNTEDFHGFLERYIRILAIGTSNSLQDIYNMTLYQISRLVDTYLSWEAYDLQVKIRLAGGGKDNDGKLSHWSHIKTNNVGNSSLGQL